MSDIQPDDSTLAQIFAEDPLKLTKSDISRVIVFFREQRTRFNLTGKAKEPKPKASKTGQEVISLSLGDLGL